MAKLAQGSLKDSNLQVYLRGATFQKMRLWKTLNERPIEEIRKIMNDKKEVKFDYTRPMI